MKQGRFSTGEDRSEKFREAIIRDVDIGTADKNDKVAKLFGSSYSPRALSTSSFFVSYEKLTFVVSSHDAARDSFEFLPNSNRAVINYVSKHTEKRKYSQNPIYCQQNRCSRGNSLFIGLWV